MDFLENFKPPQHKTLHLPYKDFESNTTSTLVFNSDFDSGNCSRIEYASPNYYYLWPAADCEGISKQGNTRSWFYFSVRGIPANGTIKMFIQKINMLYYLHKKPGVYTPVIRINGGDWKRFEGQISIVRKQQSTELGIYYQSKSKDDQVYFAFSYPFSYEENQSFIREKKNLFASDPDIYLVSEKIAKSPQNREINLLTLSSHDKKLQMREEYINDFLFPSRDYEERAFKFDKAKPVILITSRVHPGETPSSFAMNGIINFLLNKKDGRAFLLRKYFVFMILPMINPDGVYNGYYRMDIYNQNLNRYYNKADPQKQPSIYAVKELVEYLNIEKRLFFYFDLHAHAARKGCFLYGNALDDFIMHVENKLYAKLVSLNCMNFEYENCNFSKKHMNTRVLKNKLGKDRGEKFTKEGCGRVFIYKTCKIVHSYTLECGFHYGSIRMALGEPSNRQVLVEGKYGFQNDQMEDIKNEFYKSSTPHFTKEAYENVGKNMMISILDIFEKNPFSRLPNTHYKTLEQIRKVVANETTKVDRFRKGGNLYKKLKNISNLAQNVGHRKFMESHVFSNDSIQYLQKGKDEKNFQQRVMTLENQSIGQFKNKIIKTNSTEIDKIGDEKAEATSSDSSEFSDSSEEIDTVFEMMEYTEDEKYSPSSKKQLSTDVSPSSSAGPQKNAIMIKPSFSSSSNDGNKSVDLNNFVKRSSDKTNTFVDLIREKRDLSISPIHNASSYYKKRKGSKYNNMENFVCSTQEFKPTGLIKISENTPAVSAFSNPFNSKPRVQLKKNSVLNKYQAFSERKMQDDFKEPSTTTPNLNCISTSGSSKIYFPFENITPKNKLEIYSKPEKLKVKLPEIDSTKRGQGQGQIEFPINLDYKTISVIGKKNKVYSLSPFKSDPSFFTKLLKNIDKEEEKSSQTSENLSLIVKKY